MHMRIESWLQYRHDSDTNDQGWGTIFICRPLLQVKVYSIVISRVKVLGEGLKF